MSFLRLLFLGVILIGLAGLILQNFTPAVSLVFLGMRSQPLGLGLWIVAAIASGMLVGGILLLLLRFFSYLRQGELRSQLRELESGSAPRDSRPAPGTGAPSAYSRPNPTPPSTSEPASPPAEPAPSASRIYEVEQQPTSGYQSGSTYSYSYRNQGQTGVGRRESVVDADYRVIRPPAPVSEEEEDWFEDQDEEEAAEDRGW